MQKTLQVCCDKTEIEDRLAQYLPNISYSIAGDYNEYTLYFASINADTNADIDSLFEEEAYNNDEMKLAEMLVALADECGIRFSTAESCTGGMIASAIVDIAGCSSVFLEGLVTYSNQAKVARLDVSEDTLCKHGAVSAETAVEMANGLLSQGADMAISVTGIAGPGGGTKEKPVGLVYIAVVSGRHTDVFSHTFKGDRNTVRRLTTNTAMFYAIQHLKDYF